MDKYFSRIFHEHEMGFSRFFNRGHRVSAARTVPVIILCWNILFYLLHNLYFRGFSMHNINKEIPGVFQGILCEMHFSRIFMGRAKPGSCDFMSRQLIYNTRNQM
jgi:hypothetical protein